MAKPMKPVVQERPSRRTILGALATLAVFTAARGAIAQGKAAKSAVRYQDQPKGAQRCSGCAHFISSGECKVVEGPISPNGWCMAYAAKS